MLALAISKIPNVVPGINQKLCALGDKASTAAGSTSSLREEEVVNYVISIIENLGGDVTKQHYWDIGRWSDLWRVWRVAGDDRSALDNIEFQV